MLTTKHTCDNVAIPFKVYHLAMECQVIKAMNCFLEDNIDESELQKSVELSNWYGCSVVEQITLTDFYSQYASRQLDNSV